MGYFYLIKQADVYVFLDHVQFEKNSWQSRNKIKGPNGAIWLTIPTHHKGNDSIKEIIIDSSQLWAKKHLLTLKTCYSKAPYFSDHLPFFESVYREKWQLLADLNIYLIKYLCTQLGLSTLFVRSSELGVEGKRTEMVLNICKKLKAEQYLASVGAEEYMRQDGAESLFRNEGIKVEFMKYSPPVYPQLFGDYVPNLSIIDLLFNCGSENSRSVFNQGLASFWSF
jgi:hypothetical protein